MPYVNIRVAGSLTEEQKANISQGVTDVIAKEANKPPETVLKRGQQTTRNGTYLYR